MAEKDYINVSFGKAELVSLKKAVTREKPYHERISLALALRLASYTSLRIDVFSVLDEINYLEGLTHVSKTKKEEPFTKPPLVGLWHKHFFSARHLVKNIGIRWNLDRGGNKDLSKMISEVAKEYGENTDLWPNVLSYRLVNEAFEERAERGLTGDWIIYAKHKNTNYYLDLATHEEGRQPGKLLQKLINGCGAEFPFVFK